MYSYPLGDKKAKESDFSVFFDKETMDLKQFTIRAHALNITSQIVIHALQPITPVYFAPDALEFQSETMNCTQGSEHEQGRLDYYVEKIIDIIFNT